MVIEFKDGNNHQDTVTRTRSTIKQLDHQQIIKIVKLKMKQLTILSLTFFFFSTRLFDVLKVPHYHIFYPSKPIGSGGIPADRVDTSWFFLGLEVLRINHLKFNFTSQFGHFGYVNDIFLSFLETVVFYIWKIHIKDIYAHYIYISTYMHELYMYIYT